MEATKKDLKNLNNGKIVLKRDKRFTYILLGRYFIDEFANSLNNLGERDNYFYQPILNKDFIDETKKRKSQGQQGRARVCPDVSRCRA